MDKYSKFNLANDKFGNLINIRKIGEYPIDKIDLPNIIYKYRSWEDEYHKTIITDRIVYFAPPSSFPDEHDCKNPIKWDLLTKKDIFFHYYNYIRAKKPNRPKYLYREFAKIWSKKSPLNDKDYLIRKQKEDFRDFDQRIGILSLTADPYNEEMWKVYSDNYKGFCIGFDTVALFKHVGGGAEVQYVKDLPIILPRPYHSFETQHFLQVFYKELKWFSEKEYRTHYFSRTGNPLTSNERKKVIPPEAFKEIILGKNMPNVIQDNLIKSIPSELKHLKIIK